MDTWEYSKDGNTRGKVRYEDCSDSPREWDNASVMVLDHVRYDMPHEGDMADRIKDALHNHHPEVVLRWLRTYHAAYAGLVYGHDHGQLSISVHDECIARGWDSGLLGIVYVPWLPEDAGSIAPPNRTEAARWAEQEVTVFNQYLIGEVYSFEVEGASRFIREGTDGSDAEDKITRWDHEESCGGYYGEDDANDAMRDYLTDDD